MAIELTIKTKDVLFKALRSAGLIIILTAAFGMFGYVSDLHENCEHKDAMALWWLTSGILLSFAAVVEFSIAAYEMCKQDKSEVTIWFHRGAELVVAGGIIVFFMSLYEDWKYAHNPSQNATLNFGKVIKMEYECTEADLGAGLISGCSQLSSAGKTELAFQDQSCFPIFQDNTLTTEWAGLLVYGGAIGLGLIFMYAITVEKFAFKSATEEISSMFKAIPIGYWVVVFGLACAQMGMMQGAFDDDEISRNCTVAAQSLKAAKDAKAPIVNEGVMDAHDHAENHIKTASIMLFVAVLMPAISHIFSAYVVSKDRLNDDTAAGWLAAQVAWEFLATCLFAASFAMYVEVISRASSVLDGNCGLNIVNATTGQALAYEEFSGSTADTAVLLMTLTYGLTALFAIFKLPGEKQT